MRNAKKRVELWEVEYLKVHYPQGRKEVIINELGRSWTAIIAICKRESIRRNVPSPKLMQVGKITWRKKEGKRTPYIRCENKRFMRLKDYLWEQANGLIPVGHKVQLIDEAKGYVTENLCLMTDSEVCRKNGAIGNASRKQKPKPKRVTLPDLLKHKVNEGRIPMRIGKSIFWVKPGTTEADIRKKYAKSISI